MIADSPPLPLSPTQIIKSNFTIEVSLEARGGARRGGGKVTFIKRLLQFSQIRLILKVQQVEFFSIEGYCEFLMNRLYIEGVYAMKEKKPMRYSLNTILSNRRFFTRMIEIHGRHKKEGQNMNHQKCS
jgi:hypothetical protein